MRKLTAMGLAVCVVLFTSCTRQPPQTKTTDTPSQSAADDTQIALPETTQTHTETQSVSEHVPLTATTQTTAEATQLPDTTTQPPHTSVTVPEAQPPQVGSAAFTARSVRVSRRYEDGFRPAAVVAENREQLLDALAFADSIRQDDVAAYSDEWFGTHRLIVIALQENSGSVRHDVRNVAYSQSGAQVSIKRNVPDVMTSDIAHWILFIELPDTRLHGGDPVELIVK